MILQKKIHIKGNNNRYTNKWLCDVHSISKHTALYPFPTEKRYILFHYQIQTFKA
jgi:hypothetical protein